MRKTVMVVALVAVIAAAVPAMGSQWLKMPFDKVVRESALIVRGTMGSVSSAWDAEHEVIYSYATINVSRHIVGDGARTIMVREVGGTVDGYTQQAIGFPILREGEEVVLMLRPWEDGDGYRIHAYRQGKYIVHANKAGSTRVIADPAGQGDDELAKAAAIDAGSDGMDLAEFEQMVQAASRGARR